MAFEPAQVVLEKNDGGREDHAPALGERLFAQAPTVEIGDFARTPNIELDDAEVLAHIVVDVSLGQHLAVQLGAVGAAALFKNDGQAQAGRLGLGEVLIELEKRQQKPTLAVLALISN